RAEDVGKCPLTVSIFLPYGVLVKFFLRRLAVRSHRCKVSAVLGEPMSRTQLTSALALSLVVLTAATMWGDPSPLAVLPGVVGGGVTLLPNGWKIAPAGRHIQVGDLPLAMIESPDGGSLLVATNGYAKPTITVVDLKHEYVRDSVVLDHAW